MKIIKLSALLLAIILVSETYSAEDPAKKYYQGYKLYQKEKYAEAEILFTEFIDERPFEYEIRDALFYLGEIKRKTGDYLNAISFYNILTERYPHSRHRVRIDFLYGECYYYLKVSTKSITHLNSYLEMLHEPTSDPLGYIYARYYLGEIHKHDRHWQDSADNYHKALVILNPSLTNKKTPRETLNELKNLKKEIYYNLGMLYADKLRNNELAHYYLTSSIELGKPKTPTLQFLIRSLTISRFDMEHGLPDDAISDIIVDGDDIWISTWGGGVVRFSRSSGTYTKIPLPSSQIRNLYVDFESVYISSYDGIFIFDKKRSRTIPLAKDEKIFTLAQKVIKDDRTIYFSTLSSGVIKYDIVRKTVEVLDESSFIKSRQTYAIFANHEYVGFGTIDNGAIIVDKKTEQVHYINKENGMLADNNVKALLIDGRYAWIGVHKIGIYRYDLIQKKIKFFDWGLPYPSSIALRGKKIWIGTSGNGIRIFDRETGKLEKLTVLEGLSSNEVHILKIEDNYIWIGYLDNGIDVFYRPEDEF